MINNCFNVIAMVLIAVSVTSSTPIPSEPHYQSPADKTNSLFNLPFLEFKNGGVRVNFAGYHAEAGLGGLFGDSRTSGGLYAGAGTPFGAHASAGLGGNVDGENGGNTRGGLHARAGLGNGGPEAAAGLGGNIDGANASASDGRIYAAKSNGGRTRIVFKNIDGNKNDGIQRIPPNRNEKLSMADDVNSSAKTQAIKSDNEDTEMVRREINSPDEKLNAVEPIVAPVTDASFNVYPTRRCRRKRLCNNVRKTIIHQQVPLSQIPASDFGVEKYLPTYAQLPGDTGSSDGIISDNTGYKNIAIAPGPAPSPAQSNQKSRTTTLFDDIFNIPISALTAVNQLLNNKAG
ncbi:hypothetical protein PV328_005979 [Microctonus aethiopoides]|uniref:Uncharacterized protein n=1 Tax=Microctonus aethiopoides TaxID=144406 RepID=A0AA39KT01_9HYME|nr:hypothetical protein PV328_005979 [Microctonus aethiopoides]